MHWQGQFNFAEVVVEPCPGGVNLVGVAGRPEIQRLVSSERVFVSDPWLPQLVRQKALQSDVSAFMSMHACAHRLCKHACAQ